MEKLCKRSGLSTILGIYVFLVGAGVPTVVRNAYSDIPNIKYYYYCFCTILLLTVMLVYSLTIGRKLIALYLKQNTAKNFISKMSIADISVLIFLMIAVISTFSSDYFFESFWGNEGRFTGLFLMSLYVISYFCVSRFLKFYNYHVDLILITGIFICIFGITDYFQLDIFHFKVRMIPEEVPIFTSTIGNINTYTAYVGMIVALATVLYAMSEEKKRTLFYYFTMIVGFFAIVMGASDNAYLSLIALFGFLPLYIFKNEKGIQRYLIMLATFFSVIQIISRINGYYRDNVLGLDGVFNIIIDSRVLPFLIAGLWGIAILCYLMNYRKKSLAKNYGNFLSYAWLGIILVVVFMMIYFLYDCNIAGNMGRYGKLSNYLVFDDEWGTHRGYIWRNAMECYMRLPAWKKVIGFGPETFGILLQYQTRNNPYNQLFDSAHNEYLHLLITVGIAGLISYLSFILFSIKGYFRDKTKGPYAIAIAFAIICYCVQAFVNINLPIVTPVFWLLIGIGSAKSAVEQK